MHLLICLNHYPSLPNGSSANLHAVNAIPYGTVSHTMRIFHFLLLYLCTSYLIGPSSKLLLHTPDGGPGK